MTDLMKMERKPHPATAENKMPEHLEGKTSAPPPFELAAGGRMIFRGMKADGDGPEVAETRRSLGVKLPEDLDVDAHGIAKHNHKGMSTSPDSPMNLPPHRRDAGWDGTSKDPVWGISLDKLRTTDLDWHEDQPGKHGILRPTKDMPYQRFKSALEATRGDWKQARRNPGAQPA